MTRKRKRSNMVRNTMILAFVIVVFIILVAASSTYKSGQVKYEASEYFEITGAGYFPFTGNESTITITTLGFYIKAVNGDAHNVHVRCGNMESPELVGDGTISKGESISVEIYPNLVGLPAVGVGNEFPIEVSIESIEASGGITVILEQR